MALMVDDYEYDSLDEMIESLVNTAITDRFEIDEEVFMVLPGSNGKDSFVYIYHDDIYALYRMYVCNEESISSGLLEDYLGPEGTTIEDVWYDVTGLELAAD